MVLSQQTREMLPDTLSYDKACRWHAPQKRRLAQLSVRRNVVCPRSQECGGNYVALW